MMFGGADYQRQRRNRRIKNQRKALRELNRAFKLRGINLRRKDWTDPLETEPPLWHWGPTGWAWWVRWSLVAVVSYVSGSWLSYRLSHPELSETQLFLDFWPAMTWQ